MARDYVCVNTTQFLAGAADTYPGVSDGLLDFAQASDQLVQEFTFGVTPAAYPSDLATRPVRQRRGRGRRQRRRRL